MKKKKNNLLWKVERVDCPKPSFLFGTMHVKDKKAFQFLSLIQKRIIDCDAFATEFNLEEAKFSANSEMLNLPEGTLLEDLIPPKKFVKANKYFTKITGYDLKLFNTSLPMMLTNLMAERFLSQDMAVSLDELLWNFAKENDRIILGVETLAEQLEIMQKIPLELQVKSFLDAVKNIKAFRKATLKITEVYQSGDILKLQKMSKKSIGGLRKILLYDRNIIMADRIGKMMEEQSIFIAIGAGHLAGKKGVLRLLKQQGYKLSVQKMI